MGRPSAVKPIGTDAAGSPVRLARAEKAIHAVGATGWPSSPSCALKVIMPAFGIPALLAWPLARWARAIERDDVELLRSLGRRKTA